MTKEELIDKLSGIEWEEFEVKEAKSEIPKSSWETVSAFANTNGGWLILGVKQIGKIFEISGVKNAEKLEQDFLNTLRGDKFNVKLRTQQSIFNIEDKKVLGFYIEPSPDKPIYYNNLTNTYIRRGSSDQKATKSEIDSMYRDQSFGTKTSELVPDTNRESLDNSSIIRYRDYMSRFNPTVRYNRYEEILFLEKLRVMEGDQCTYAGLLMFGKRDAIEKVFPNFRIDLLEVPGTSYENAKLRYTYRLGECENLWEYYFECLERISSKVNVEYHINSEGFGEEVSVGLESLREAIVNMFMHADYFSSGCSRIRVFNDHIEFFNFGGLPKPLEELKSKDISLPRNPIITKLFRMVSLAENAGFGIEKIESKWQEYSNTTPQFEIDFDSVIVKMYNYKQQAESTNPIGGKEQGLVNKIDLGLVNKNNELQCKEIKSDKETNKQQVKDTESINERLVNKNNNTEKSDKIVVFKVSSNELDRKLNAISQFLVNTKDLGLVKRERKIVEAILKNRKISKPELAKLLNVSTTTIDKYLGRLKQIGILKRVGTKSGYWIITDNKK